MFTRIGFIIAILIAIAALSITGVAMAQGQAGGSTPTITTIGYGSTNEVPDTATISVGSQTSYPSVSASLSSNAQTMSSVIAALRKMGIPASSIQTQDLSLYEDQQQHTYQVIQNVSVTVAANQVSQVYATAASANANNFGGVAFSLKDSTAARDQALKAALADARHRANVEAQTLGFQVTGVRSTTESTSGVQAPQCTQGCGGGGGPPVQSGQLAVTADVAVTYTVRYKR